MRELTSGVTASLLGPLIAGDPHRPRLIWHDAGRTELSTATLANWAAKTAGYLTDELVAAPGSVVQFRVIRSWQGAPLLLGAWWAGMVVTDLDPAEDAVVAFVDENDDAAADEVIVASSHPFGLATAEIKAYQRHVAEVILQQADRFTPRGQAPTDAVLTDRGTVTVADLLEGARAAGDRIGEGGRVLSVLEMSLPDLVTAGLLGALAADGSLIQVAPSIAADPTAIARIADDEGATVTLGIDIEGLPRLD